MYRCPQIEKRNNHWRAQRKVCDFAFPVAQKMNRKIYHQTDWQLAAESLLLLLLARCHKTDSTEQMLLHTSFLYAPSTCSNTCTNTCRENMAFHNSAIQMYSGGGTSTSMTPNFQHHATHKWWKDWMHKMHWTQQPMHTKVVRWQVLAAIIRSNAQAKCEASALIHGPKRKWECIQSPGRTPPTTRASPYFLTGTCSSRLEPGHHGARKVA